MFLDVGVKLTQDLARHVESRRIEQERKEDIAAEVSIAHLDNEESDHQM
jgi:hypothetical protein